MEIFARYPLHELILHPRTRKEGYAGSPHRECYAQALSALPYPVVYNGDLFSLADCQAFSADFPHAPAVMLGRGLAGNPALAQTFTGGAPLTLEALERFHRLLFSGLLRTWPRDAAVGHMHLIMQYLCACFENSGKAWRAIRRATMPEDYEDAAALLFACPLREAPPFPPRSTRCRSPMQKKRRLPRPRRNPLMKISKKDALTWFSFFAALPEEEELMPRQQEIACAALAQIEEAVEARRTRLAAEIPHLKTLENRTYYVGGDARFPKGCRSCLLGTGLSAVRKTNRCNIQCKFCYNYGELDCQPPIGEGLWEIGGTKFYEKDLELLFSIQRKPTGVAYVYLEPFMEIEKYYGVIRKFHQAGVYQHLYTNGTLANEENLRALGEAGLDELRFNLGATACADRVIENIRLAKRLHPYGGCGNAHDPRILRRLRGKEEPHPGYGPGFYQLRRAAPEPQQHRQL